MKTKKSKRTNYWRHLCAVAERINHKADLLTELQNKTIKKLEIWRQEFNAKKIMSASLIIISLFALTVPVFAQTTAQNIANELCKNPQDCPVKSVQGIYNIIARIVGYVYTIFFIVAVLFILFAAFTFLTAQGDPNKIISARNQILWACVAIAVALISVGAQAIIRDLITPQ